MFKLNRRSEYALMAIQHIARCERGVAVDHTATVGGGDSSPKRKRRVSVAAMAQSEQIPQPLLAKVMQDLKKAGIVRSIKGVGGGYALARPLEELRFVDVIAPFEDQVGLVDCAGPVSASCERMDCCSLADPIKALNRFLMEQLGRLTMADFVARTAPPPSSGVQQRACLPGGSLALSAPRAATGSRWTSKT